MIPHDNERCRRLAALQSRKGARSVSPTMIRAVELLRRLRGWFDEDGPSPSQRRHAEAKPDGNSLPKRLQDGRGTVKS